MSRKDTVQKALVAPAQTQQSIIIGRANMLSIALEIQGDSIIQNNFSQKAVEEMLRKHMGISVQREKKKPRELLEHAKIKNMDGRICVPPQGIKAGMITGGITQVKGLKKKLLQTQLFIEAKSIPITYERELPRMDPVRLAGMGRVPDIRFRPEFQNWKARLIIMFADLLSAATVVDLVHRGGTVGVGEWRPEKNGTFGTYRVVRNITDRREIEEVRAECMSPLVPLVIPDWALDMELDPEALGRAFAEASGVNAQPGAFEEAEEPEDDEDEQPKARRRGRKTG